MKTRLFTLTTALVLAAFAPVKADKPTGDIGSHDPSRLISCNGRYYFYSTGGRMSSSSDLIHFTAGPSPFPNGVPASLKKIIPSNQGIWAPDVCFRNNKYYLYYSVAAQDNMKTAIGLMTSPTLDPNASGYGWTDVGLVVSCNDKQQKRSAIDPCPNTDADGNLWLAFGSGYANGAGYTDPTIFVVRLNNTTGLLEGSNPTYYGIVPGHIEGAFIYRKNGYYYAFWNSGGCCSGASSTYTIHVARSASITGPYVDRDGNGGGSSETFLAATVVKDGITKHGPGHMGVLYNGNGIYTCSYHYYPDSGGSVLGEDGLTWGSDGWPSCDNN